MSDISEADLELIRADAAKNIGAEWDDEDGWLVWQIADEAHDLGDGNVALFIEHMNGPDSYYATVVNGTVHGNSELDAVRDEYDADWLALSRIKSAYDTLIPADLYEVRPYFKKLTHEQIEALSFNELAAEFQSLASVITWQRKDNA